MSARTKYPDAAKAFVKWLWVDNTDAQLEFALDYGFHIPARNSLAEQAEPLKSGAAASALAAYQQYAFTQTPVLWTPASDQAYSDARTRMITEGADPADGDRQGARGRRQRARPPRRNGDVGHRGRRERSDGHGGDGHGGRRHDGGRHRAGHHRLTLDHSCGLRPEPAR